MMYFLYAITNYIGYFLILLVFLIVAIILAKKTAAWIVYGIGAFVQLLSLYGNYQSYSSMGFEEAMTPYWIVYIVLLVVAAITIVMRRQNR